MDLSDDILMAFADGELGGPEAEAVARRVAADPAVAARVAMFRRSRELLATSAPRLIADRDADLAARIRAAVPGADGSAGSAPSAPANLNWRPVAVAASVAAAAVVAVLALNSGGPDQRPGLSLALSAALDSVPSGETADLPAGRFAAIATYRTAQGSICREYESSSSGRTTLGAIACRDGEGWHNRFVTEFGEAPGGYAPAAADTGAIDAALERIGAGDPLPPEDEAAALGALRN